MNINKMISKQFSIKEKMEDLENSLDNLYQELKKEVEARRKIYSEVYDLPYKTLRGHISDIWIKKEMKDDTAHIGYCLESKNGWDEIDSVYGDILKSELEMSLEDYRNYLIGQKTLADEERKRQLEKSRLEKEKKELETYLELKKKYE